MGAGSGGGGVHTPDCVSPVLLLRAPEVIVAGMLSRLVFFEDGSADPILLMISAVSFLLLLLGGWRFGLKAHG